MQLEQTIAPSHRRRTSRLRIPSRKSVGLVAGLFAVAAWSLAAPGIAQEPNQPPASPAPGSRPAPPSTEPRTGTATKTEPPPAPQQPAAPPERPYLVRAAISTRGPDDQKIGLAFAGEMRAPLPWGLQGGPGIELAILQSQTDSNVVSFLPVYWAVDYRPLQRFSNAIVVGRAGFDLMGQAGDDTLASRNFYAVGLGLLTRTDQPKALQWEILYSRAQGAFPGVALSVGYRF